MRIFSYRTDWLLNVEWIVTVISKPIFVSQKQKQKKNKKKNTIFFLTNGITSVIHPYTNYLIFVLVRSCWIDVSISNLKLLISILFNDCVKHIILYDLSEFDLKFPIAIESTWVPNREMVRPDCVWTETKRVLWRIFYVSHEQNSVLFSYIHRTSTIHHVWMTF